MPEAEDVAPRRVRVDEVEPVQQPFPRASDAREHPQVQLVQEALHEQQPVELPGAELDDLAWRQSALVFGFLGAFIE